jgi:hypothetical protein
MMNWKFLALAGLAAVMAACGGGGGTTTASFSTGPDSLVSGTTTAPAAPATYTVTFAPGASGNVNWTINPTGTGTLSAANSAIADNKASVQYTPPNNITAATQVTIKGVLAGSNPEVAATKSVSITLPGAQGVTVNGTVLKWSGKPEGGVNITIVDAGGNIRNTASDPEGKFSVQNVVTPYQLSAIPALGTGIVPLSNDKVTITNPIVVVRKNAFAVGTPPGFQNECTPAPADGNLRVELSQPVGAGNTGEVVYIAPGINYRPTESYASLTEPAGTTVFNFAVPFDRDMCYNDLIGTVVYIERNSGGTIVAKGVRANVPVFPSTTTKLNTDSDALPGGRLGVATANSRQITGTATFPSGIIQANVTAWLRVEYNIPVGKVSKIAPTLTLGARTAYFPLAQKIITNSTATTNWDLDIEDYGVPSGLKYRTSALGTVAGKGTVAWSDVLETNGASGIALNMPSISGTEQPNGILSLPPNSPARAPGGNIIPEFRVAVVQNTGCSEGTNFLNNYIAGFTGPSALWLGSSDDVRVTLPDTNEPARIGFNTTYTNFALNSLCIREANVTNVADKVLDGRGIQRNFYTDAALTNPDFIRAGVFNLVSTDFEFRN